MHYKLNVSGRGKFFLPHKNGRTSYLNQQSLTTNGRGLLEAKSDHNDHVVTSGTGVGGAVVKETSRIAKAVPNLTGLKSRLASLSFGGRGTGCKSTALGKGKKKYISLNL